MGDWAHHYTVTHYPAGLAPMIWTPGDAIVTTNDGIIARAIRFGQRRRFAPIWCWANHAAYVADQGGALLEALSHGITASRATKYQARHYAVIHPYLTPEERAKGLAWAQARYAEHREYGWWTISNLAVVCLTGTKVRWAVQGEMICSGFVAGAFAEGGEDLGADPTWQMPAGLCERYKIGAP